MTDLLIRAAAANDLDRAVYLFRNTLLRPQSRLLLAVRSRPVKRFVAAAAWWPEGTAGRFQLVCQPGIPPPDAFGLLIDQVIATARQTGLQTLQYADLLADDEDCCHVLRAHGFRPLGTNRFFEAHCQDVLKRLSRLFERHQSRIPSNWRTESIRKHPVSLALQLLHGHGLLPPTELESYWRADSPAGFDPEASSFLFDGARPIGTLLARLAQDTYFVDVRIVQIENRPLRALGNLLLLHHMAAQWNPAGPVQRLQFHGGQAEHRETANLAFRMGGRELPPRHIYARNL